MTISALGFGRLRRTYPVDYSKATRPMLQMGHDQTSVPMLDVENILVSRTAALG